MTEDAWLALVERIEQAMAVIPFQPRQEDVITLLSMAVNGSQDKLRVEDLELQIERLRAALDEIAALGNGPLGEIARRALGTWSP